jgi:hypothetical protein
MYSNENRNILDQEQRTQIAELYHYILKDNNLVEVVSLHLEKL